MTTKIAGEEFLLTDLLAAVDLPLKKKVDEGGYYAPSAAPALIPTEPLQEGEQYRFHFDMTLCVGCQCCVVACNEQNNNPAEVNWRRVGDFEGGIYPETRRHHLSMACNHCLDPACQTGCPTGAYTKEQTGVVVHHAEECIGCGYCTWNCPYGVPQYNPERNIVTKCDMCHNRLARGEMPACVQACPEQAIQIEKVNIESWRREHHQAEAPLLPESDITLSTTRITLPPDLPKSVLRSNRHRLEPERPHYSLIFLTVLTQLAAGGFLALWLCNLFSKWMHGLERIQDFLVYGASGMFAVAGIALNASVFHLGRPLFAYKALRMWRTSWLSREVLLFGLFSLSAFFYSGILIAFHFAGIAPSAIFRASFGALVTLLGFTGIFASAKIYQVPARPAWNTLRTPFRFYLTGLILGPLWALVIYTLYGWINFSREDAELWIRPIQVLFGVSSTAAFFQLMVLLERLLDLVNERSSEQYDSALLLIRKFKNVFILRVSLLVVANFLLPVLLTVYIQQQFVSFQALFYLSLLGLMLALAGELLGRYLFFVTVVPKNMPGSFFTRKAGH